MQILNAVVLVTLAGVVCFSASTSRLIKYQSDRTLFANPERGFFSQGAPLWFGDEQNPQSVEFLQSLRVRGISMVRWYFLIDEFRTRALTAQVLSFIGSQFDAARQAGIKVIPRFAYNFPTNGTFPYTDPDAPLSRVLGHLTQLAPVLQNNVDVTAFMELGFVGAWGEWHSSTNALVGEGQINDASRSIVDKILQVLPQKRTVAMRYPPYKQQLYGTEPLDPAEAFTGTPKSRMGGHNDCFLASVTDWGTYSEDRTEREASKTYLNKDNRFVPQGGETCNADKEAKRFIQCANAIRELRRMRWSTLNIDYHQSVLSLWRRTRCFPTISRGLGYRFRLVSARIPTSASSQSVLNMTITLKNEGFASPYNARKLEIVMRKSGSSELIRFPLTSPAHDLRRFLPELGDVGLALSLPLKQQAVVAGTYELLLNMPDPEPTLYSRVEYSIRLANQNVWEPSTGFNRLLASVVIS